MTTELKVPSVGESITEVQIGKWFKTEGQQVNKDEPVVEIESDKVTLELPNPGGALRPGAFARVRLKTGSFANALLLPRRGVVSEDGEDYVFVARGDSAVRVPVKIGAIENDTAQITTGLTRGDRVVTVGQGALTR